MVVGRSLRFAGQPLRQAQGRLSGCRHMRLCGYKVHGEWKNFLGHLAGENSSFEKVRGVSDLEWHGER